MLVSGVDWWLTDCRVLRCRYATVDVSVHSDGSALDTLSTTYAANPPTLYYTKTGTADAPGGQLTVDYAKIYGLSWPAFATINSPSSVPGEQQRITWQNQVRDSWFSFIMVAVIPLIQVTKCSTQLLHACVGSGRLLLPDFAGCVCGGGRGGQVYCPFWVGAENLDLRWARREGAGFGSLGRGRPSWVTTTPQSLGFELRAQQAGCAIENFRRPPALDGGRALLAPVSTWRVGVVLSRCATTPTCAFPQPPATRDLGAALAPAALSADYVSCRALLLSRFWPGTAEAATATVCTRRFAFLLSYCEPQDMLNRQGVDDLPPTMWYISSAAVGFVGLALACFAAVKGCCDHKRGDGSCCGCWETLAVPCGRPSLPCACCRGSVHGRQGAEPTGGDGGDGGALAADGGGGPDGPVAPKLSA